MAIKTDTWTGGGGVSDITSVNGITSGAVVLSADDLAADHTASNYTAANNNIDGHLSGIDTKLGTFASGLTYKGSFNATAGTPSLLNAEQGDLYIIDTAGTIYGQTWAIGDHLLINADMGGTITNSKIDKVDNTDAITSVNGITSGAVVLSADDLAADHTASNYTPANSNIDGHLSGIDSKLASQLESGDNISLLNNNSGFISDITGESLNDLSDVTITAAANGEVLKYNGSAWVDASVAYSEITGTPSLATVATTGAYSDLTGSPTNVSTFTNDSGYLTDITGESINDLSDVTITTATNGQVLSYNGSAWVNSAASSGSLAGLSDTTITAPATGEVLKYNGSAWVDASVAYSEVTGTPTNVSTFTNDSGYLTAITGESIDDLSDVTITTPANGQVLSYNGSAWVNSASAGGASALDDLTDVTITAAASGEYLRYSGSAWVDASLSVVDDTTPQLGGNLDTNSNEIVTASNANVILRPNGTGVVQLGGNTNPAEIRLYCESADAHYVGLKSPAHASLSGSQTWTLPTADGTNGQVLQTNGSGSLSFVDQSAGGGGWTYSAITADPANAQAGYHYSCTGTFTITLPTSGVSAGAEIRIKNMGTGTITIDPQTQNIDDSSTDYTLDIQFSAITLVSTGSHWEII